MRIYVVFMLRQIWNQKPLWEVARTFGVPRGWLQSMLQTAISQSSSIVRFAEVQWGILEIKIKKKIILL